MFLTPFVDFGGPIEALCGLGHRPGDDDSVDESPMHVETSVKHSSQRPFQEEMMTAAYNRARIVSVSDKVRIIAATEKGTRMEGTGIALGSGPLDQSKAYFEVVVDSPETTISVGAVGRNLVLAEGWQVLGKVPNSICVPLGTFNPGDIVGVLVDISNFPPSVTGYEHNDVERKSVSTSVRGDVWPAIEIHSGSVTVVFARDELKHLTPQRMARGVEAVMISRSII